jgi:hypothetical protein
MKTFHGWDRSGQKLDEYVQMGDVVDQGIVDYFLTIMPPATWRHDLIQMGEPADFALGRVTFMTLERVGTEWIYRGECWKGRLDSPPSLDTFNIKDHNGHMIAVNIFKHADAPYPFRGMHDEDRSGCIIIEDREGQECPVLGYVDDTHAVTPSGKIIEVMP